MSTLAIPLQLGTGEIEAVEFKNEYALHSTANSMLIIAYAEKNMDMAGN